MIIQSSILILLKIKTPAYYKYIFKARITKEKKETKKLVKNIGRNKIK